MRLRKLLICTDPRNEIEAGLKRMYLKRVQEMFKRTLSMESIFNIFDEVLHGLSQASLVNESLYSLYESLLTITSYYQHSQAGRGSLVADHRGPHDTTEKNYGLSQYTPNLLGANPRDVWHISTQPCPHAHFAAFPPNLIRPMILAGCPVGGVVLDPFMGAGTTAIVALKLNRNFVGIEINPQYIEIAKKRIRKEVGELFLKMRGINL